MLEQLERAVQSRLEPEFNNQLVETSDGEDTFQDLITKSFTTLLLGIETKLDIPLAALMRRNWNAIDVTGDQSDFMGEMCSIIKDAGAKIRPPNLSFNYFTFFCDKLIRSFSSRLLEAIFRCGTISHTGGQQLRLDVEALRICFIALGKQADLSNPSGWHISNYGEGLQAVDAKDGTSPSKTWSQSFSADVSLLLTKIESVLKVVTSPDEGLVDTFMELMADGGDSRLLSRILDLKGIRKPDAAAILEDFKQRGGKQINSADSSASKITRTTPVSHSNQMGFSLPPGAAAKASAAAQDMASRIKLNANRLSAAAASDSMRETMGRTLGAMKSFRFMNQKDSLHDDDTAK